MHIMRVWMMYRGAQDWETDKPLEGIERTVDASIPVTKEGVVEFLMGEPRGRHDVSTLQKIIRSFQTITSASLDGTSPRKRPRDQSMETVY